MQQTLRLRTATAVAAYRVEVSAHWNGKLVMSAHGYRGTGAALTVSAPKIPQINGEFKIPGVSIHTLGDLFVPFIMQQVCQKRVAAKGNGGWLVQRAIRGASHGDFTVAGQVAAFDDRVQWESDGIRPAGVDVLTPATVAASNCGCSHTRKTLGPDDGGTMRALRPAILATTPPCP
jgi:hypothetical protein